MKPRERVEITLNHQSPDRPPMQVGLTPEFAERLRADLHIIETQLHNPHGGGNSYAIERALGADLLLTSVGWANSYYQADREYVDEWGVGWRSIDYQTAYGTGRYTEMAQHPLADARALDGYVPPDPNRAELYLEAEKTISAFQDEYWIVGVTVTTVFETAWALRGYEQLLMDFVTDPDLVDRLLDIPYQYHLTAAKRLVELGVDMIWIGDDVGAQNSMLISPRIWRRFFKQRMATFIAALKSINPLVKVAYHSDGCILPIIPDLIEIGLDVLNPIQPGSMEPAQLKREYGDRLSFWGTIDEQFTLPMGTPADVAAEVRHRIETVGKDGGLILGPTHSVQLDTPLENFWAMINTIRENEAA